MGHARRKAARPAIQVRRPPATESWIDDSAVDRILGADVGDEDGDPPVGIRNAVFAGAAVWVVVGLLLLAYLS